MDRKQNKHPVLRNYSVLGRIRYFLVKIGPELRQYFFNYDREGKYFSRKDYQHIVKKAKYKRDVIGFGSQRDFEKARFHIRNAMFPKLTEELKIDLKTRVTTNRYLLIKDPLFTQREEKLESNESVGYLLDDKNAIAIGEHLKHLFKVKGQIGMSTMSYGSLGDRAITAL